MHYVKPVKSADLLPTMLYLLNNGQRIRLTVTGDSMKPFLREDIDSVELSKASFDKLRFGQIVLIRRDNGQLILHRVVARKKDAFFIAGDAQNWKEGPLRPDQLIAYVEKVYRGRRCIGCTNALWVTASFLWWLRFPLRYVPGRLKRLYKKLFVK